MPDEDQEDSAFLELMDRYFDRDLAYDEVLDQWFGSRPTEKARRAIET